MAGEVEALRRSLEIDLDAAPRTSAQSRGSVLRSLVMGSVVVSATVVVLRTLHRTRRPNDGVDDDPLFQPF